MLDPGEHTANHSRASAQCSLILQTISQISSFLQTGLATFLTSLTPVLSSKNSLQLTGTIWFPASLTAITTPSSFFAVLQK